MANDTGAMGAPKGPGALEWEALDTAPRVMAVAVGVVVVMGKATELTEARLRTRRGSPSPSWAAWSRT